ncbi:thiamine biosynthesis protein ThiF [Flavobacterium rivuli WB 3.3-2 = DSM 21788]|uniref:Thiamine biosynthesis protein ThiF n=1 Tax=Flavobacterium rivuli WB 3.3-2 = DSM 21788 TaxID=1121895 RepID=A0A0A2MCC3_9FLAO|nr:PRTRC system ThiF family protein [Flavobacterium rivuli]KGO85940.1 thiamine biosynthesis protein ThiF [Flavobacterium rivuli WB 3.3-2 = DSM 21788]
MKPQTAMHYADNYLINPTNPITVNLIGAGGTGSHVLTALSKMNYSLVSLGHAGLQVTLYDADTVTPANKGRQLFADSEVGLHKSVALVNRVNRFFGTNWKAVAKPFNRELLRQFPNRGRANIYITCVDTVAARLDIAAALHDNSGSFFAERDRGMYWMDMGNAKKTGQVILSTIAAIQQPESKIYRTVNYLPAVTEEFREQLEMQFDSNEPSCSLAEALEKQDLFINPALADLGGSLLWNLFRNGMTSYRGFFLNLADFRSMPITVG